MGINVDSLCDELSRAFEAGGLPRLVNLDVLAESKFMAPEIEIDVGFIEE